MKPQPPESKTPPDRYLLLATAIKNREELALTYHGSERIAEPQTFGRDFSNDDALRLFQTSGESSVGLKFFKVAEITGLGKTGRVFSKAHPLHNPDDSAMKVVYATLPRPKNKKQ